LYLFENSSLLEYYSFSLGKSLPSDIMLQLKKSSTFNKTAMRAQNLQYVRIYWKSVNYKSSNTKIIFFMLSQQCSEHVHSPRMWHCVTEWLVSFWDNIIVSSSRIHWTEKSVGFIGVDVLYAVRDVILVQCAAWQLDIVMQWPCRVRYSAW